MSDEDEYNSELEYEEEEEGRDAILLDLVPDSIIVSVERTYSGHTDLCYSVIYYPKIQKFVSCSWDGSIRLWNFKQNTNETIIQKNEECTFQLIPFTETEFVAVLERGKVYIFSIESMKKIRDLHRCKTEIFRVIKLNSDLLLVVPNTGELYVISYSQHKYLKKLSEESVFSLTFPIISKKYENCFYINLSEKDQSKVKMIDFEENKELKVFCEHGREVFAMATFSNNIDQEILVCGGKETRIHIYNTATMSLFKSIDFHDQIRKFIIFNNNKYMGCGDYYSGYFTVYDIKEDFRPVFLKKIHDDGITDFQILSLENSCDCSLLRLISGSFDNTLRITRIENLPFVTDTLEQFQQDLKERIVFIRGVKFVEDFVLPHCENSIFGIKMYDVSIMNIFKSILL